MGLINVTQQAYYSQSQSFTGNGSATAFTLTTAFFPALPSAKNKIQIFMRLCEREEAIAQQSPTINYQQ